LQNNFEGKLHQVTFHSQSAPESSAENVAETRFKSAPVFLGGSFGELLQDQQQNFSSFPNSSFTVSS
jgi:hypothetical protein